MESSPIVFSRPDNKHFQNRIVRLDRVYEDALETRSELLVRNASLLDNGTFHCQAENKAARIISNFTLHVTSRNHPQGYRCALVGH